MSKSKILFGLTGSIACYKSASIISSLVKAGHEVQAVATPSALKFLGEATLEGLTHRPVLTETFATGKMMDHIYLARWADLLIVAPMTALHVNKFALGLADDLLTTIYLAYEKTKPFYIAPAMNSVMLAHDSVQESLATLKRRGAMIIEPNAGLLACGEDGPGKMAEPDEILKIISNSIATPSEVQSNIPPSSKGRILITFGGTREAIDGVRSITNTSTGETGARLCDEFTNAGFQVTALCAEGANRPRLKPLAIETFVSHGDLEKKIEKELSQTEYNAVLHLAAVSDYSVDKIIAGESVLEPSREFKVGSDKSLALTLKPNRKIISSLRTYSRNKNIHIIGFKLTNTNSIPERHSAIEKLLNSPGVDYVVHNDVSDIDKASGRHVFRLYGPGLGQQRFPDVVSMAQALIGLVIKNRESKAKPARFSFDHQLL